MAEKNSSIRIESFLKRTRFSDNFGFITRIFKELEVDKLINEKFYKERLFRDFVTREYLNQYAIVRTLDYIIKISTYEYVNLPNVGQRFFI